MTNLFRTLAFLFAAATAFAQSGQGPSFPPASPTATLKQRVGLTDITIVYSRPGVKGRKIFGEHGITPDGLVWRTGANEPTLITLSTDVTMNGTAVPAGTYALYTIPNKDEWTIIIYKDTKLWGAFGYDQSKDFARFTAKPVHISHLIETFEIGVTDIKDDSAKLLLGWEKTEVPIHLEFPQLVSTVSASIEAFAASSAKKTAGFDYNAANFYLTHGPDLDKALHYADAMIATGDAGAYEGMYVRAKVLQLKGDKAGAAESAQKSKDAALKREGLQTPWGPMNDAILAAVRE